MSGSINSAAGGDVPLPTVPSLRDRLPGDSGVWVFIFADMCAFALFFILFMIGRVSDPAGYESSRQHLNTGIGLTNTLILLTSGLFMALAVHSARAQNRAATMRFLIATLVVGSGFGILKIYEYTDKIQGGITMLTNEFFMYYFIFTGIHFVHFIIGCGVLAACIGKTRKDPMDGTYLKWIESTGCYWHMVDLLWIILFPMLYLLRA